MGEPGERTFYRIVREAGPTISDFLSDEAQGEPLPHRGDPMTRRMWQGISAFATEAQARNKARDLPMLGSFIAELVIPGSSPIEAARTSGRHARGHHTLWGDPTEILECVSRVVAV